jgi:hypothetical protein
MAQAQLITRATHGDSLADILERVLNTGLVIAGDIRIKLCDVELLSIQIRLLICSVEKARELGISWWWQSPEQPAAVPVKAVARPPQPLPVERPEPLMPMAAKECRPLCEVQRFQEAMHALEQGPQSRPRGEACGLR